MKENNAVPGSLMLPEFHVPYLIAQHIYLYILVSFRRKPQLSLLPVPTVPKAYAKHDCCYLSTFFIRCLGL